MRRLEEALDTLGLAVDLLEESAASALASQPTPTMPRQRKAGSKAPRADDVGSLFSPAQLNTVKQRLDDAIERLESALEVADGTR